VGVRVFGWGGGRGREECGNVWERGRGRGGERGVRYRGERREGGWGEDVRWREGGGSHSR